MSKALSIRSEDVSELPPVLIGNESPRVRERTERFYISVAEMNEPFAELMSYLMRLPNSKVEKTTDHGDAHQVCIYTPHALRATTATLLLESGEDIKKVQGLLRHRHVSMTQIYDKRRFKTSEGLRTLCHYKWYIIEVY